MIGNKIDFSEHPITHAPSKKLKNIKMLKSSQNSRRGLVEKTQIDYSQESKHLCMAKAYYNALKRRLDSIEGMVILLTNKDNENWNTVW